jgi:ubiquinol-cytochrome c reductase cytochrome b subunit
MLKAALDWLDTRAGYRQLLANLGQTPLPGGARWARTLGPLIVGLFALEALTGVGLAAWYAPSSTDAWASVNHINNVLALGWLLRGVHHVGGTLLVIVAILHLVQLVVWAAYRAPRELAWLSFMLALQALIVTSHTGYLLPQDLRAYWATQVLVGIAGNQPLVGGPGQLLIQGGDTVGNTTLTHLYALHVFLGPGGLAALLLLSWLLMRKAGLPAPPGLKPEDVAAKTEPWAERQALYDFGAIFLAVAGVVVYVVINKGVHLDAPGDPAVDYLARPEWYMMPIFTLRHFFTGQWEFIATVGIPGLGIGALCGLPFIYARLEKAGRNARLLLSGAVISGLAGAVALGAVQAGLDAADPKGNVLDEKAARGAELAKRLAMAGVPVEGPLELHKNDPVVWGARVFERECVACHERREPGKEYKGSMALEGYASRAWLKAFLAAPSDPHFFGNTKIDGMDPFTGEDAVRDAIVEFLMTQTGREGTDAALAATGRKAYEDEGCETCHSLDGKGTGDAPDLKGWASTDWLKAFIRAPGAYQFYGEPNEMDAFGHDVLTNRELSAVIAYLHALGEQPVEFAVQAAVKTEPKQPKEKPVP